MEFRRRELAVARRAAEIAAEAGPGPREPGYEARVKGAIAERAAAGEDVSGYTPEFVRGGSAAAGGPGGYGERLAEAGREIAEFARGLGRQ